LGAPDGTVSFLSGSTLMGTVTLNSSCVATLTTTLLAAGTYSLTAQYAGDTNLLASTSAAVSLTVNAQTVTTDQAFSLNTTGSTLSQTVQPGNSAVYTLNVSPALGTTLPAITFTTSGLPQGYTVTFSPQTIAAGSGATNVTLTIQVPAQTATAMLERDRKLHAGLSALAFCILLLPFGGRFRRSGKRLLQLSGMVLLLFGLASVVGLAGCTGPAGQFSSQNSQTYTITVTTTSASQSQTANVTLIVE
ncbi:MAG: Ig-like domain repeat protein, partial [Terracidiphilus sp.]